MNSKITIVTYHFVRELTYSRYPEIKGLDVALFKGQILYLKKYYNFITMEQLIDAIDNNTSLPEKAVLLTFDDAYLDHFTQVFPVLLENNIQGSFFPPAKAITEHKVLDVNKIHFVLASCNNTQRIIQDIYTFLDEYRIEYNLETNNYYYSKLAEPDRFNSAEVIFIKRLLQVELIENLRSIITHKLFLKYIDIPESAFSRELYMNIDQIKTMRQLGMHIGTHGYDHYWLNYLSKEKQLIEIKKSLEFIKNIGGNITYWTMCYPYGGYNKDTLDLLSENNCKLALTINLGISDIRGENRYTLSRLDTNDLPKNRNSTINKWYTKA